MAAEFFDIGGDENTTGTEQTEPVIVNPTQSNDQDFAFMEATNPYDTGNKDAAADNVEPATTDEQPKQENDDPFASMVDNNDGGNANADDLLGSGGGAGDAQNDGDEQKEVSEDQPTFLSVWQEERKLELQKRVSQEKEEQQKLIETAQTELEKFESDRAKRIENKKKENREKEKDLRDDLDAVFKHGTIWEQVGKMVNLNEKMSGLNKFDKDRFRDLLIHLRNAKQ